MIKNKKILISGGAGAIGTNLCLALLKYDNQILIIDNLVSGKASNIPEDKNIQFNKLSITDPECERLIIQFKPTIIFHLAAFFANQNSIEHPTLDLDINIKGTVLMLQIAQKLRLEKFVFTSSSCVYGTQNGHLQEHLKIESLDTPYAISKYSAEHYCKFWNHYYNIPIVILRLFNSFGPWEHPGKYRNVIPNFFDLAIQKKPLTITGTGEETRDFNYVDNTVSGLINAVTTKHNCAEIYNIASGNEIRIIDLATKINEITGNPAGISFLENRDWDNIKYRSADIALATKHLRYIPKIDFSKGLHKTLEWFMSHKIYG